MKHIKICYLKNFFYEEINEKIFPIMECEYNNYFLETLCRIKEYI